LVLIVGALNPPPPSLVIPEKVLLEKGYIGKESIKSRLFVSPTNMNTEWCDDYLFDYNNVDKERLLNIIELPISV
jgi:hypothetical protein